MTTPLARKLYLRIWLTVAGSVAVLGLLVGWAWHVADEQRDRERERQLPQPREVLVRDAAGALIGTAEAQPRRVPGQGFEFAVTLDNGQVLNLQMAPRPGRGGGPGPRRSDPPWSWLRPPYGFQWMLGLAGLVVMAVLFPVARRLTQRLEALQRGVQRWGEGDLSARLPEGGQDEVADLSRRFNAAAERVQSLMASQAALLQSQKSLLANASHELRSPLARIRMAVELSGTQGSPAARDEIQRSITELDQLVDEILLASRLDAREADIGTVESVDLIGLLAEECARVGAVFELPEGTGEVVVPGVARLLRRAVRNLLENAVRHGRRTGHAEVVAQLSLEGGYAVLHIDDRGPGVPPDQRERIFEPFYRLPGASEREGGVGLGLALVRQIAARHGGSVACDNREGGGARFTLRLPKSPEIGL
ncbi:MAG TPA: ATP-binding protein [Ottowia sp.]|nr:HAMP domain-containing protein [Ottowia sp.]MBP7457504.1 HAMP domain-containing protein [Ottowia sp.]MBP8894973.1 HAMP domain-containing protein [Ottowia sp.]MBP9671701.1 HAMP domain-containing protein [Ottowia sp.]HRM53478.1 ATP-binding protein [Ottowia sp.]